jgi:hypothetical protein
MTFMIRGVSTVVMTVKVLQDRLEYGIRRQESRAGCLLRMSGEELATRSTSSALRLVPDKKAGATWAPEGESPFTAEGLSSGRPIRRVR